MSKESSLLIRYFENIIGFNNVIEFRVYSKESWEYEGREYNFFSRYAKNINEAIDIINSYTTNFNYNIYNGINARFTKGKKEVDVERLKNIVFDIESHIKKPFEGDYKKHLLESALWLEEKIGMKFNVIKSSGRGLHCYISFKKGLYQAYKHKYGDWYNKIHDEFVRFGPYGEGNEGIAHDQQIKMDKNVKNYSRILGTPYTYNTKYTEPQALRQILVLNDKDLYDEEEFMRMLDEKYKEQDIVKHKYTYQIMKRYTEKTIFKAPELNILINYSNVPEGQRYSHILLPIKMLMRDSRITNYDEVIKAIEQNGYKSPKIDNDFPDNEEYVYSRSIFGNWCFNNWEWCVNNNYLIPDDYKFKLFKREKPIVEKCKTIFKKGPEWDIRTWDKLVMMMRVLNQELAEDTEDVLYYDVVSLERFLENNLSDELRKFVRMNKMERYLMELR